MKNKIMKGFYITLISALTYFSAGCSDKQKDEEHNDNKSSLIDSEIYRYFANKSEEYKKVWHKEWRIIDSLDHLIEVYREAKTRKPNQYGMIPVYNKTRGSNNVEWLKRADLKTELSQIEGERRYTQFNASEDSTKYKMYCEIYDEIQNHFRY
jgi:hypothetical protein